MKVCNRSLIGPRHANPRQNPRTKRCSKTQWIREARSPWLEATTGRSGCHGHDFPSFLGLLQLFHGSLFSHMIFSVLYCYFAFNKDLFGCKRGKFPASTILHHLVLLLVQIREREREAKDCKDIMPGLQSKDSSAILVEHFFHFSSLFSLQIRIL